MQDYKKYLKLKPILLVIALIGGVYIYHSFSKEAVKETAKDVAIDLAKDAGKYALNKVKDKFKGNNEGGAVLSEGTADEPSEATTSSQGQTLDDFVVGTQVQKTEIKDVANDKFISVDSLSISANEADLMMMNAIRSADLERVKYLVSSGVKIDFTDDKICAKSPIGSGSFQYGNNQYTEYEMPADHITMKKSMRNIEPGYIFTTSCNKLFLTSAIYELKRELSESEFEIFYGSEAFQKEWQREAYKTMNDLGIKNGPGVYEDLIKGRGQFKSLKEKYFTEKRIEMTANQKMKREVVDYLISITPNKDYYQFVPLIGDANVPQDLRVKLANAYIQNIDNLPISESRKKFIKLYEESLIQLLQESPTNQTWLSWAVAYKAPLFNTFTKTVDSLVVNLTESIAKKDFYANVYKNEKKQRPTLSDIVLPEISVKVLESDLLNPFILGVNDDVIKFANPSGYTNFNNYYSSDKFITVYLAKRDLEIMKILMKSGKFNINMQDAEGQSILHNVVINAKQASTRPSLDRAAAVVIRFLLNNGVNPGLIDKKGASAHGTLINQENDHIRHYPNSYGSYKEMKNSFTLKSYN